MSDSQPAPFPVDPSDLAPELLRFVGPGAPPGARMMAARSLAPLPPGHMVTALYLLCFDPEPSIVAAAQQSMAQVPDEVLRAAIQEPLPAVVLDYLTRALIQSPPHINLLLLNRALPDDTIVWFASVGDEHQLEVLAANQQRLLRAPAILEALYFNPHMRQSTMDKLLELAIRNGIRLDGIPAFREIAAALGYRVDGARSSGESARQQDAPGEEQLLDEDLDQGGPSPESDDQLFASLLEDATQDAEREAQGLTVDEEAEARRMGHTATELGRMTASQKIRLASLGSAGDRAQLVRDPKRIVAMAAIKSPKVNAAEVEQYAGNPAIHGDVIRYIAANREWTRSYKVKLSLILNPKCPLHEAITFLKHLRASDLKGLAVSRNVPEVVASTARNLMRARNERGSSR